MRIAAFLVVSALLAAAPASAAQSPTAGSPSAAGLDARAVVADVRRVIAERYVLPERRPALDAVLAEGLASGRYAVAEPRLLAERINEDLARVGRDRHLNFSFNPEQSAVLAAANRAEAPDQSGVERQARAGNHGVRELRVLPGNVRYMDYRGFNWIGAESAAALETAMRFLAGGDAVIIDLRRNGGGSPEAVQYLVSHFIEAGRPLVTFHFAGQPTDTLSALAEVPAGRLVGKPLYVLTSNGTASAAEEFTGHVAGYRLGEVVGETTAGAGFRNDMVAIDGGFVLSVSTGRAVLASTNRDWEAVGIVPTMPTPVATALEAAQAHALRRLAAQAQPAERARLEALAETLAARVEPRPAALPLQSYAGEFGERIVSHENGRLYYRRGSRAPFALVALGGNRFAFEEDPLMRIEFSANGTAVSAFEMQPFGGPAQGRYERTR
ncbi:MAG TPA: S41 family peptidase [Allosphingosinicella sp.]|nr:S41 family peptidase [Allosphingosinicella sp.]